MTKNVIKVLTVVMIALMLVASTKESLQKDKNDLER